MIINKKKFKTFRLKVIKNVSSNISLVSLSEMYKSDIKIARNGTNIGSDFLEMLRCSDEFLVLSFMGRHSSVSWLIGQY